DYSDEIAREIDDEIRRIVESAHVRAREILTQHRASLELLSEVLIKRETIEKDQFEALLNGQTEAQVFGTEAPASPEVPIPGTPVVRPGRDAPRPLPRPGLAGGTAEARGSGLEKPDLG
ncbi:MAG: ATP-dependent zinc metalloprotease FtsH, partial [Solirubrobacteraceae bacterium]